MFEIASDEIIGLFFSSRRGRSTPLFGTRIKLTEGESLNEHSDYKLVRYTSNPDMHAR